MPQATGSKTKIVIGEESTFKTPPGAGFLVPFNSCSIKSNRQKNTPQTITGNYNPVEPFDGNLSVSGSLAGPVDSTVFWYLLKLAFGTPVTTGSGPYEHVFKLGNDRPSFTLEEQFSELSGSSKYIQYTGCKISGLSMSMGGDGELTVSFDVAGADRAIETAPFDSTPEALTLTRLSNKDLSISENSAGMTTCTAFDISVDFGLDTGQYCIGDGGTLGSLPDGVASVTGTLKALFSDMTLLQKALNSTESSITATLSKGADSLEIKVTELQYSEDAPAIDGPQGIQITLPYTGYYSDASEETALQIRLTNSDEHP